jgi:hypothetical protein
MTLEETIKHYIEKSDCAEHVQLAKWLQELQYYRYIETNGRWMPCSVKEPYEKGDQIKSILVTMEDYKGGRFVTNTLNKSSLKDNKIVAWMPVPQPYNGKL